MPVKAPPIQPPIPIYNWTGFYIGGNVGYGWSDTDVTATRTVTVGDLQRSVTRSATDHGQGVVGGGQIGFNYEFLSRWVVGIEADIDATNISSPISRCLATATGIVVACGTRDTKLDDFGTLRGRLGYAFNNVLLYGTGGWAWGHSTSTTSITCLGSGCPATSILTQIDLTQPITLLGEGIGLQPRPPISVGVNPTGWAAGAGVEWGFLPNWTLRAEYLHLQFDGITEDASISGTARNVPVTITNHVTANAGINIVRVGVNYLFHHR